MKKQFKNKWLDLSLGYYLPSFKICPEFYFDGRTTIIISFLFFQLFITLPFGSGKSDESEWRQYGFYCYGEGRWNFESLCICFGHKTKFFYMPWSYDWIRTSTLKKDGTFEHETKGNYKDLYGKKWDDILWNEKYPYTYTLRSGETQNIIATIKVKEYEWRMRWLKWTKLFAKISKSIDINFSGEVGERAGSWKGGVTGCSYNIKKGEIPLETLRRMELERKF